MSAGNYSCKVNVGEEAMIIQCIFFLPSVLLPLLDYWLQQFIIGRGMLLVNLVMNVELLHVNNESSLPRFEMVLKMVFFLFNFYILYFHIIQYNPGCGKVSV
jgi:hypothetical protein